VTLWYDAKNDKLKENESEVAMLLRNVHHLNTFYGWKIERKKECKTSS
jgi:hypothetical protein